VLAHALATGAVYVWRATLCWEEDEEEEEGELLPVKDDMRKRHLDKMTRLM
jgi:hypothetical protein